MKAVSTAAQSLAHLAFRLLRPIVNPLTFLRGIYGYGWFLRDMVRFKHLDPSARMLTTSLFPCLHDRLSLTPVDAHYFYQQVWAFERIIEDGPEEHVDVGSSYQMSGYLSAVVPTKFIDIRPITVHRNRLTVTKGSILDLPFASQSVSSLSCLHVVEHIGLGRYGDPIDPQGMQRACRELSRILRRGGSLYVSMPIGKKRLCFNAHRITPPSAVLELFSDLELKDFCAVDDRCLFHDHDDLYSYESARHSLGMFLFVRTKGGDPAEC